MTLSTDAVRACQRHPGLFHAPDNERHGSPEYYDRVAQATALCLDCPIMLACRDRGRELCEIGIWGGETDGQRAAAGYPTGTYKSPIPTSCGTPSGANAHRRRGEKACSSCVQAETGAANRRTNAKRAKAVQAA